MHVFIVFACICNKLCSALALCLLCPYSVLALPLVCSWSGPAPAVHLLLCPCSASALSLLCPAPALSMLHTCFVLALSLLCSSGTLFRRNWKYHDGVRAHRTYIYNIYICHFLYMAFSLYIYGPLCIHMSNLYIYSPFWINPYIYEPILYKTCVIMIFFDIYTVRFVYI